MINRLPATEFKLKIAATFMAAVNRKLLVPNVSAGIFGKRWNAKTK
jgi:hypothetical protein